MMNLENGGDRLSTAVRAELEKRMAADERLLWSDRPVPAHAWTVIGTTFPRSLFVRAITVLVFEAMALVIAGIGLLLLAFFLSLLFGFPWTANEFVGMLLIGPFGVCVAGAGLQAMYMPWMAIRLSRYATYALTTHYVYTFNDHGGEMSVERFDLSRITAPGVYRLAPNGVGDVILDSYQTELAGGDSDTSVAWFDQGMFAVPNAVEVASQIDEARRTRQNNAPAHVS